MGLWGTDASINAINDTDISSQHFHDFPRTGLLFRTYDIGSVVDALYISAKGMVTPRRRLIGKMITVASANDLTLYQSSGAAYGNFIVITGATQINGIATTSWDAGSVVELKFDSTPVVKHNTAASAGFASLFLSGAVDFSASANDVLTLVYDGTLWREVARRSDTIIVGGNVTAATFKVGANQVVGARGAGLTAQLTSLTHTAPSESDYVLQDLTDTGGFGFKTKDEGNTVLSVILNLQTRVAELEARLGSSTGHGLFT